MKRIGGHRRGWLILATGAVTAAAVAGCGSSGSATAQHHGAVTSQSVVRVAASVTARILPASATASSHSHEAVFTLTATDRAGQPAAGAPVSFWIGPMYPKCDTPIRRWYPVADGSARKYVAFASTRTNAAGQATLTLYGQPARTMEMVAANVGDLSSFSGHRADGLLDAWWTKPGVTPAAPVGDAVTVSPFLTSQRGSAFNVHVTQQGGKAVSAAEVLFRASGSAGMSGMSGGGSGTSVTRDTNAAGDATFAYPRGAQGTLRVQVYRPGSSALFSGGMNSDTASLG